MTATWHRIELSRQPDGVVLVAVDPESAEERSSAAPNLAAALVLAQRMAEQPERYGEDA